MTTSYKRQYGATLRQLAARFGVSYGAIWSWHEKGQLREAIETGKRPRYDCLFRRIYGASSIELATRFHCAVSHIHHLHRQGLLDGKIAATKIIAENERIVLTGTE